MKNKEILKLEKLDSLDNILLSIIKRTNLVDKVQNKKFKKI